MASNNSDMKIKCRDLIYVGISVPVSLLIYSLGSLYSRATNHNGIVCGIFFKRIIKELI
jgi:hypothetical protein